MTDDPALWLTLALYREGKNAGSPFYKCLAFRNALDAMHNVERETVRRLPTPEATSRDAFIDALAPIVAGWFSLPAPKRGWPHYLRYEVRNALAHVLRRQAERMSIRTIRRTGYDFARTRTCWRRWHESPSTTAGRRRSRLYLGRAS